MVGTPHHVTRHRSAPALIQDGPSPAKSAISDATLLNSPRRASPFSPRTPFRIVDADDDYVITSSSSRQDLSSTVWGTNRDGDISRYRELVEQLQADLATERENALHDRGVARQALGEAEDDIADLKAEVLDIKDELVNEKQNCQNSLDDYYRCDRDATIIITECHERIAKLEANLYLEQRKARHNYAKAEEYMGLAQSWQDAFHQLGHDPDALWKMLVEELKVRGIVFDYCGHLHRVGLRKTILDAEDADQWVAGLDDRSLLTQEASERTDRENTTDAMTQPGDTFAREQFEGDVSEETNRGQSQVTAEGKTAGEKQADGKANEEHVTNKDRHIDLKDIVDANRMDEQTQNCTRSQPCGTEPLIDVNTEEAVPHDQRHGVSQGNDIRNLVVRDREEISSLEVEDEADIENVTSNCGLADDVSDDTQLTDCVRQQNKPDGADGHEIAPRIPSVKDCEMEAVNWSSNRKAASWETPSRLLNPQISFLGLRHSLALPTMGNGFLRPLLWSHRGIEVRT